MPSNLEKWFIPPPNKPVEIRLLEEPGPLFPHAQFVRKLEGRWGPGYYLEGSKLIQEGKEQDGEDQPSTGLGLYTITEQGG